MTNIELKTVEESLRTKTFTQETSPLSRLNFDFAPFKEKTFIQWLNFFNQQNNNPNHQVLEIGGGPQLIAAQEILSGFPYLTLFEIELRPISQELLEKNRRGNFKFFNLGFSEALENPSLKEEKFVLIFAHNVLSHLPNPFFIVEQGYQLLAEGGILFVNDLMIYKEVWEEIVAYLQEKKYSFSWKTNNISSSLQKKGIISVSFTVEKKQLNLIFPIQEGNDLTDFSGQPLGPKEYFFSNS